MMEAVPSSPFAAAFFLVCWTMSAFSLFSFRRASRLPMTRLVSWGAMSVQLRGREHAARNGGDFGR